MKVNVMADLFEIVGENFFKPFTSYYKSMYLQCLRIIYESYRTELSYGIDRELLITKLTYYFDALGIAEIQFDDEPEMVSDSRAKASTFLRKLKEFGWVEYEIGYDQRSMVIMPNYAVSVIRNLEDVIQGREMEYQSEISSIYSLLTNPDLMLDPYPQVLKPVYERTVELFTGLKQLNTGIKKYLDMMTADKTADEIVANYFNYVDEIGSKAYHRLFTSDNVSRFRNVILIKLDDLRNDETIFKRLSWGYQKVEGEADLETAIDQTRRMIADIIDYFNSYDEIVREIEQKHRRYLDSTVKRARFLLMNTNNIEGKINTVLRYMADQLNKDEIRNLEEDASDEICNLFNIFSQGFASEESIKSVPLSRKINAEDVIYSPQRMSEEELQAIRLAAYERNKNRFSKRNVLSYVNTLLEHKDVVLASSINIESKRDMIRLIFISLYGQTSNTEYTVVPCEEMIETQGFRYHNFEIRRKE